MDDAAKTESGQLDLFGGGSSMVEHPTQSGDGGSSPTPPLQVSELRLERISIGLADSYSIKHHYLHRTAKNSKIAFGIFGRGELHGIMIWGLPVAKIKGQYGKKHTQLELRRMFCEDSLPRNSESHCLAVSARILKRLFPNVHLLVAYSDLSYGHKGTIYKAAGWQYAGTIKADADGGWSKHPRHRRVEFGDKIKWVKPL